MTRETRFRISGLLFYVVFILNLSVTYSGRPFFCNLLQSDQTDIYQAVATLVGVGALLFTSDVVGYVFSTICYFFWNPLALRKGKFGYAAEMEKLGYDLKSIIIERYKNSQEKDDSETLHKKFEGQWEAYSPDVFLSYIFQQAPPSIVGWTSRRHTALFAGMAAELAIFLGLIFSAIAIYIYGMGWTSLNTVVLILSIGVLILLYFNARQAGTEARQMIDLWIAQALNPNLRAILKRIQHSDCDDRQL